MLIAIARRSGIIVATVVVVAVSAILWPLENSERRLAASGAKLCYALDETLLVGAKLEGEAFGDEQVQVAASVSSMQRLSLAGSLVTQRGIQSLMLAKKLSSLNLSDTNLTSDALAIVCGFPLLRELELNRCGWLRDEHLSQLAALQKLEFLSLTGTSVTAVGMEHLRQVPALKFVRLVDCRGIDDSSIDAVIRLCERRNLSIDLSGTEVTLQGLTRLRGAVPNGRIYFHPDSLVGLREISQRGQFFQDQLGEIIGFRRKGDTDGTVIPLRPGDLSVVGKLDEIRELHLDQSNVDDSMLQELQYLPRLETLRLSATRVTDDGLRVLAGFPNLKTLWLMETDLDGPGLTHLSHLSVLTNLKIQTRRGDEILKSLAPLSELRMLSISAPLTADGMESLAGLLPQLKFLALVETDIHGAGISKLSASSNLTELRFDGGSLDDADIPAIAGLTLVRRVMLNQTKVSRAGRDRLVALRPDMFVQWPRDTMMSPVSIGR